MGLLAFFRNKTTAGAGPGAGSTTAVLPSEGTSVARVDANTPSLAPAPNISHILSTISNLGELPTKVVGITKDCSISSETLKRSTPKPVSQQMQDKKEVHPLFAAQNAFIQTFSRLKESERQSTTSTTNQRELALRKHAAHEEHEKARKNLIEEIISAAKAVKKNGALVARTKNPNTGVLEGAITPAATAINHAKTKTEQRALGKAIVDAFERGMIDRSKKMNAGVVNVEEYWNNNARPRFYR